MPSTHRFRNEVRYFLKEQKRRAKEYFINVFHSLAFKRTLRIATFVIPSSAFHFVRWSMHFVSSIIIIGSERRVSIAIRLPTQAGGDHSSSFHRLTFASFSSAHPIICRTHKRRKKRINTHLFYYLFLYLCRQFCMHKTFNASNNRRLCINKIHRLSKRNSCCCRPQPYWILFVFHCLFSLSIALAVSLSLLSFVRWSNSF